MFEISDFHKKTTELILDTPAPGKHCARNAIYHVEKAWEIKDIDPNMAAFRAITGEEEAATAIMHALIRRKYKGATKLKLRNHSYKASFFPFFQAIASVLSKTFSQLDLKLEIESKSETPKIKTKIKMGSSGYYAYPEPPLNFQTLVNGKIYNFSRELDQLAEKKNVRKIRDYISQQANQRNLIIYASNQGIPTVDRHEELIKRKVSIVFGHIVIYLLIDQYKEHQLFVQQALDAFFKMHNAVPTNIDDE